MSFWRESEKRQCAIYILQVPFCKAKRCLSDVKHEQDSRQPIIGLRSRAYKTLIESLQRSPVTFIAKFETD